jgi:anti-sigma factor RsiW
MRSAHASDENIEGYVLGRLGAPESAPVVRLEEHLLTCPRCLLRAEDAVEFAQTMRDTIVKLEREMDEAVADNPKLG